MLIINALLKELIITQWCSFSENKFTGELRIKKIE